MTKQEIEQFRKDFKSIVYIKGLISANNQKLNQLDAFNKYGSHDKAILRTLSRGDELKAQLRQLLKGKNYDEWKLFSKKLSVLNSRLTNATNQKDKLETDIQKLNFIS